MSEPNEDEFLEAGTLLRETSTGRLAVVHLNNCASYGVDRHAQVIGEDEQLYGWPGWPGWGAGGPECTFCC